MMKGDTGIMDTKSNMKTQASLAMGFILSGRFFYDSLHNSIQWIIAKWERSFQ